LIWVIKQICLPDQADTHTVLESRLINCHFNNLKVVCDGICSAKECTVRKEL
jgi:hypothetical protein